MTRESRDRIAVVGGSIIGVAIAFELQRRGRPTLLIDRAELGRGTSYGSMASIAIAISRFHDGVTSTALAWRETAMTTV